MSFIGKVIILAIVLFFAVLGYACFLVASTSDRDAERMYQDYQEWKSKKEEEKKWKK